MQGDQHIKMQQFILLVGNRNGSIPRCRTEVTLH